VIGLAGRDILLNIPASRNLIDNFIQNRNNTSNAASVVNLFWSEYPHGNAMWTKQTVEDIKKALYNNEDNNIHLNKNKEIYDKIQ
jgi:hypothetical protein